MNPISPTYTGILPYANQAYANAYFADRLWSTPWTGATNTQQVAALKTATRYIDRLNFVGSKANTNWYVAPLAPSTPVATPGSGGSLVAGNYQVALGYTYGTNAPESILGPAASATVGAAGTIAVSGTVTPLPAGSADDDNNIGPGLSPTGYTIYVSFNGGLFMLATSVLTTGTATISFTISTLPAASYPAYGNGQVIPCAVQPNQFPRGGDTSVPNDIAQATCELALALLDDVDPNIEIENLSEKTFSVGDAHHERDTSYVQEHIRAGIPSIQAWTLLKPYIRDLNNPRIILQRSD